MARDYKYITDGFYDRGNGFWQLKINQKNYTGSSLSISDMGSTPLYIEYGDRTRWMFQPVIPSHIKFSIISDTRFKYADLVDSDAMKNMVELYHEGSIYWKGYIVTDLYTEPIDLKSEPLFFVAADLKLLENFAFNYNDGYKSHFLIAKYCLDKLEFDYGYRIASSLELAGPNIDQFTFSGSDTEIFAGMDCLEVLKEICKAFGVTCYQYNGRWHIVSVRRKTEDFTYYDYTSAGVFESAGVYNSVVATTDNDQTTSYCVLKAGGNFQKIPAIKKFTIVQDYGLNETLVKNHDFSEYDNGVFDYWVANGTVEQYTKGEDTYVLVRRTNATDHISSKYIKQNVMHDRGLFENSNMRLKLSLKYAVMGGEGTKSDVYIQLKCGNYRYDKRYSSEGAWYTYDNAYILVDDQVEAQDASTLQFKTFEVTGIPTLDGKLELKLLSPSYMDEPSPYKIAGICYTDIKLSLVNSNEEAFQDEISTPFDINANNNYIPDDIELMIGNKPDGFGNNELMVYSNIILPQNDFKYGGFLGTLTEVLAQQIKDAYTDPPVAIRTEILSDIFTIDSVFTDSTLPTSRFAPLWGIQYPKECSWELELHQINTEVELTPDFLDDDFADDDFYDKPGDY